MPSAATLDQKLAMATLRENQKTIQKALFGNGDGATTGSLINSQNVLLGGMGIGSKLDAKSLAAIMGVTGSAAVALGQWFNVLNPVLASADINTPQRLSMFLANVAQETQLLTKLAESGNT
jgi:hypothetical protein